MATEDNAVSGLTMADRVQKIRSRLSALFAGGSPPGSCGVENSYKPSRLSAAEIRMYDPGSGGSVRDLVLAVTSSGKKFEFHIILIIALMACTVYFCHSLIRLLMTAKRRQVRRRRVHYNQPTRDPDMVESFTHIDRPIPVIFATDLEMGLGTEAEEGENKPGQISIPPPAYGLWRGSVKMDPSRLYWQRIDPQKPNRCHSQSMGEPRPPSTNRPPSYISDEGQPSTVVNLQPQLQEAINPNDIATTNFLLVMRSTDRRSHMSIHLPSSWLGYLLAISLWLTCTLGMLESQIKELRKETEHMFFHGFENYMKYAFPEDELRPVSCQPLTRDRKNPAHIELNDVLGNYSLTLVDSLSTLAILSYPNSTDLNGRKAWRYFQNGVRDLVELYGDGSDGPNGIGSRSKGFEVDSKVQVFESVIRGLGGLLSAHLFAVGELPIRGYEPPLEEKEFAKLWNKPLGSEGGIEWENGFVYDGQLLRLARDLGTRLLPAFYTPTGIPYPRVNLRNGVPFHPNSPLNSRIWTGYDNNEDYDEDGPVEITENCSAGAGSLVLEFAVLSRLTGDGRYEEFAKRAFWSVWDRRSELGLIGAGINAETGEWTQTYTGIGAGMDSFFEYALKSHILLSEGYPPEFNASGPFHEYDNYFLPLPYQAHSPDSFLKVWEESFEAIKTNLYRGSSYQYPHYIQGDITTGATRALWMDSLSAYFPGLLTLAGNVEEAAETHLLNTALWTRFSALPERWNVATGDIEGGLEWWGGRPEFIESTYYLYRATEDPWYLYVGEMVLRDIKRRCWTKCGWAGLQNVRRGDQSDRMESFFLGETSKYLYLLFEPSHPLNKIDSPYVYSTEGHPLVLPAKAKQTTPPRLQQEWKQHKNASVGTCGPPAVRNPFGVSSTAARPDIFHAASLARLRLTPPKTQPESPIVEFSVDGPSVTLSDLGSPSNYTYFPWTLPPSLVPRDAVSSPMAVRPTLDLTFPPLSSTIQGPPSLERVEGGILIKSFGGLRLGMIQDAPLYSGNTISSKEGFRIQVVSNIPLGKNEKVFVSRETTSALSPTDPNFTQTPDTIMMDIIIDVKPDIVYRNNSSSSAASLTDQGTVVSGGPVLDSSTAKADDHAASPIGNTADIPPSNSPVFNTGHFLHWDRLSSITGRGRCNIHASVTRFQTRNDPPLLVQYLPCGPPV
ncbi:TPA_exp: alpha-1,2-Mannosidase [Trichophyton benhamiae CBS 112371]|nr:TPA_exp: alpha-1,2-Mannosidase [Trichophyton benhamiae CBS 112371]